MTITLYAVSVVVNVITSKLNIVISISYSPVFAFLAIIFKGWGMADS